MVEMKRSVHTKFDDKMPENGGVPIVLTASMIEMSDFNFGFAGGRGRGYTRYDQSSR